MNSPNRDTEAQDGENYYPTRKRGGAKRFFKWSAIGCGGLIGLFIILIIIAAIFGSSEEDPPPRRASTPTTPQGSGVAEGVAVSQDAIDAGGSHTCALRESGAAECWGSNDDGKAAPPAGAFRR